MTTRILQPNSFAILVIVTLFIMLVGISGYENSYSQTSLFQIENTTTTIIAPNPDIKSEVSVVQNTSSPSSQLTDAPSYTTTNARTNIIEKVMDGSTKENVIAFNQSIARFSENLVVGK